MELNELLDEVNGRLPDDRRRAVETLVEEYGASEQGRLLMALVAAATKRERRLLRLLLTELEKLSMRE
jgi:hypothetical protein